MAKANSAFMKPMTISADLAEVVGKGPMPRSEVVKGLWVYIKKNNLQDAKNKRNINAVTGQVLAVLRHGFGRQSLASYAVCRGLL